MHCINMELAVRVTCIEAAVNGIGESTRCQLKAACEGSRDTQHTFLSFLGDPLSSESSPTFGCFRPSESALRRQLCSWQGGWS